MQTLAMKPADYNHILTKSGMVVLKSINNTKRIGGSAGYEINEDFKFVKRSKGSKEITEGQNEAKKREKRGYMVNKKEVRQRIYLFLKTSHAKKKLYFWTITFPLDLAPEFCYQALNTWLTRCRKEFKLKSYLWVAERQQNGTTHFHLAINQYMNVMKANRFMRATLTTLTAKYKLNYPTSLLKNYNGVDISKNRKTRRATNFARQSRARSLQSYLTKYVTKNNERFPHLAWHCSREYSNLFTKFRCNYEEAVNLGFYEQITWKPFLYSEYYVFYPWKSEPPPDLINLLTTINELLLKEI